MNKNEIRKLFFTGGFEERRKMSVVYCIFRRYPSSEPVFLAVCSTEEAARKYCEENELAKEKIYTSRTAAALYACKSLIIEKVALL